MKLLIITQVIDTEHPILGFFHRWVEEFAKHCDQVHVIALQVGKHNLPNNVTVYSLGKDEGRSRFTYLFRFYKLIFKLRKEYDNVFVHMNQIYVILGALLWHSMGKKISLWYVHKAFTLSLYIAGKLSSVIFTSSKSSINLRSEKIKYVGHGINTEFWKLAPVPISENIKLVYVGRISPIKNIEKIINIAELLLETGCKMSLSIVGGPSNNTDFIYLEELKKNLSPEIKSCIIWHGPVNQAQVRNLIKDAHIHLNCSPTGGVDKSVLESMSMGIPSIVINKSFGEIFPEVFESLTIRDDKKHSVAERFAFARELSLNNDNRTLLHNLVKERVSLTNLINSMVKYIRLGN